MKIGVVVAVMVVIVGSIGAAELPAPACSQVAGLVTLEVPRVSVRTALLAIARQSGISIALDPSVRGMVTAKLSCVKPEEALRLIMAQVGAVSCTERGMMRIYKAGRFRCDGVLVAPVTSLVSEILR